MAAGLAYAWRQQFGVIVGALWAIVALGTPIPGLAQLSSGAGSPQDQNAPVVFRADEVEYDEQLALTVARKTTGAF